MSFFLLSSQYDVSRELTYTWEIKGAFEKSLAYSWTIYQAIEKPLVYTWEIHAFFEKVLSYSWTIYQAVEKPLVYSWRVMGFFLSSRALFTFRSRRRTKTFRRPPPGREDFK